MLLQLDNAYVEQKKTELINREKKICLFQLPFQFLDKKTLTLAIKDIEAVDLSAVARGQPAKAHKIPLGVSLANTMVVFERAEGSSINLAGKSKGYANL